MAEQKDAPHVSSQLQSQQSAQNLTVNLLYILAAAVAILLIIILVFFIVLYCRRQKSRASNSMELNQNTLENEGNEISDHQLPVFVEYNADNRHQNLPEQYLLHSQVSADGSCTHTVGSQESTLLHVNQNSQSTLQHSLLQENASEDSIKSALSPRYDTSTQGREHECISSPGSSRF